MQTNGAARRANLANRAAMNYTPLGDGCGSAKRERERDQDQEHDKQDLCYPDSHSCDSEEPEQSGNDRDHEEG